MVHIASGHVIGDNLWLWRADHGVAGIVKGGQNPCEHGLVVTGPHVTMYGLAVEHTLQDLVQWAGDSGETYFFQAELPYDVTQDFGDHGYVGYRVLDNVASHKAYGIGVYHFFRDFAVTVKRGIAVPEWLENSFECPLSVYLTGRGRIMHVINNRGGSTAKGSQVQWSCNKGPYVAPAPIKTTLTTTVRTPAPVGTTAHPRTTPAATTWAPVPTPAPGPAEADEDCIEGWGKCGGHGWMGPSCCATGYMCAEQNVWYSLCIPLPAHAEGAGGPQGPQEKQADDSGARITPETEASAATTTRAPRPLTLRPSTTTARPWAAEDKHEASTTPGSVEVLADHSSPSQSLRLRDQQAQQPGISIAWWAWILLASQTCAVCALGAFLWRLHVKARNQPPRIRGGNSRSSMSPWTPPGRGSGLSGVFQFQGLPALSPLSPYSPNTAAVSARNFAVNSPTRPDEA